MTTDSNNRNRPDVEPLIDDATFVASSLKPKLTYLLSDPDCSTDQLQMLLTNVLLSGLDLCEKVEAFSHGGKTKS